MPKYKVTDTYVFSRTVDAENVLDAMELLSTSAERVIDGSSTAAIEQLMVNNTRVEAVKVEE